MTEDVVVAYSTKKPDTMFQELIEFTTNDPDRPVVRLTIRGVVPDLFRADRDTLSLGEVSANDTATAEARIYAFFTNDIRIVDHQFMNPETARFFELRSAPLAADELAKERLAKGAVVASVTVKPGLPLGPVNQGVRLTTNLGSGAVVQLHRGYDFQRCRPCGRFSFRREAERLLVWAGPARRGRRGHPAPDGPRPAPRQRSLPDWPCGSG